jgi:NAD(P)-dependent dehydrogenase (short-subunit alcohol dehydrogenase family)
MNKFTFTDDEWNTCIKVLESLKNNPFDNPDNQLFKTLITSIHKKAKKEHHKYDFDENVDSTDGERNTLSQSKNRQKQKSKLKYQEDLEKTKQTSIINNAQNNTTFYTHENNDSQNFTELNHAKTCYCCSSKYKQLHFFYHKLCPDCASLNYTFRQIEPDFNKYQVIITGGRVKIGFSAALKFLRAGAKVLVSTRFPALALEQFSKESDFEQWKEKLTVYGLDLRNLDAVYQFIDFCKENLPYVDILINNAAQTIKYPPDYYQPLIQHEQQKLLQFRGSNLIGNNTPLVLKQEQLLESASLSEFKSNRFGQPIDFRTKNSWNSKLNEIGLEELLEVNFINHISPYILISELSSLIVKSEQKETFIINVTSSEGQFSYANKTVFHPHTNMTKAALNMLTRTSANDYVQKGIYMNAVDVGWISTGANEEKRSRLFEKLSIPPLDSVDGAMRIIHPILEIQKGRKDLFGKLLKNYKEVNW